MRLLVPLLALFLLTAPAHADDLRPGYLEWTERTPGDWHVTWKAPLLGGLATRTKPILPTGCDVADARRQFVGPTVVETFRVRCKGSLAGRMLGLSRLETGFTDALLRVDPLGQPVQAARLTSQQAQVAVATKANANTVWQTYLGLGFTHILFGFDHLLFVVALVLLIGGWRRLIATVTAFTVAHSITLAALAALARFAAPWQRPATISGAYAIGAVASAWLIQRTLL